MKFYKEFEYQKIPEWYQHYINYHELKSHIHAYLDYFIESEECESPLPKSQRFDLRSTISQAFEAELSKVDLFYNSKKEALKKKLEAISVYISRARTKSVNDEAEIDNVLSFEEKDHLEDPKTSLQRSYTEVHQKLYWLEVFCQVNYDAAIRLCGKLKNSAVVRKIIHDADFVNWENDLLPLRESIYISVADERGESSIDKSVKMMTSDAVYYKSVDAAKIGFCIGLIIASGLVTIFTLLMNFENIEVSIYPSFPIFRLTLSISLVFIAWSWVIYWLDSHPLNWMHMLDISHMGKVSYIQILWIGLLLLAIWSIIFMISVIDNFHGNSGLSETLTIILLVVYIGSLCCPFDLFFREVRWIIFRTLLENLIAPFGPVRFRNFILICWTISMAIPVKDAYRGICFIMHNAWSLESYPKCYGYDFFICFLPIIPFVSRNLQILNMVYHNPKVIFVQFWFVLSYSSSIVLISMTYFKLNIGDHNYIWIMMYLLCTEYTYVVDVYFDWGLWRSSTKGFMLRPNLYFPKRFYYIAIAVNFVLRFAWTLSLLPTQVFENQYLSSEFLMLVMCVSEIIRRTFWTVLRIERERSDNTEKYKKFDYTPWNIEISY